MLHYSHPSGTDIGNSGVFLSKSTTPKLSTQEAAIVTGEAQIPVHKQALDMATAVLQQLTII
jgi:hypothetical protein